jgi:hypothetical protein
MALRAGRTARPQDHGAAGQGRLLGHRDQARAGRRGWTASRSSPARPRPTSPTSPARASCCSHDRPDLSAIRHPQRPHRRRGPGDGGRRPRRFEFQRLHGMGEALHEIVRSRPGTRCRIYAPVGAHATCWPIWCGGCWRTAPTRAFVNQIVDEDVPPETVAADPFERAGAPIRNPEPVRAGPDLFAARAPQLQGLRPADDRPTLLAGSIERARPFRRPARPPILARRRREARADRRAEVQPRRPATVVGEVTLATRRRRDRASAAARAWDAPGPAERAAVLRAPPTSTRRTRPSSSRCSPARPARPCPTRVAELREAVDFLRYYAAEAPSAGGARPGARRLRLHQPLELPAGHLHRPDRRRAGRGQRGAGQAGRADAR